MKAFGILALLLAGCASSPMPKEEEPVSLGGPVAEERSIPSDYVPVSELDHPPKDLPVMWGYPIDDQLAAVVKKTGPQKVVAVLLVSEGGRVEDVIVRSADYAFFADEVRRGAMQFRFSPGTQNGRPVKWFAELPFLFK